MFYSFCHPARSAVTLRSQLDDVEEIEEDSVFEDSRSYHSMHSSLHPSGLPANLFQVSQSDNFQDRESACQITEVTRVTMAVTGDL